jgi:hypothetical protein
MRYAVLASILFISPVFADDPVTVTKEKGSVEFKAGAELIAKYNVGESVAKPFVWPLNAPGGKPVTRPWPMVKTGADVKVDHIHQKSAWFCHGDVIPEGLELKVKSATKEVKGVDFWDENAGHGKIVCVEVGEPKTHDANHVSVPTKNSWQTADGIKVLDENRTLHVYRFAKGYLIVFEIDLDASVYPLTFGDTKEGSMGVRVPDNFRLEVKEGGKVTSSDGKTVESGTKDNLAVWGLPADWNDYSGKVGSDIAGIAVFDDPANAHRALWHTRAYGLMAANPFGREKSQFPGAKGKTELVKMAKGEHMKLRYGLYTHTGDAKDGEVANAFQVFKK